MSDMLKVKSGDYTFKVRENELDDFKKQYPDAEVVEGGETKAASKSSKKKDSDE